MMRIHRKILLVTVAAVCVSVNSVTTNAQTVEQAIKQSDDFERHKDVFVEASETLIAQGRCSLADFREMGGWVKSTSGYADRPVYFTFCGGMTRSNRIYLDAASGQIFK